VSKCVNFRDALLVPVKSNILRVSDLRSKKIAVPFGSGAHRIVIELLKEANLDVKKDVTLINLDVTEINAIVQAGTIYGTKSAWQGNIAAVANWDPNIAEFEAKKLAKVLVEKPLFGVTAMSEKFIRSNRSAAVGLIKALHEALFYYGRYKTRADRWYAREVNINFDPTILKRSASFDSNLRVDSLGKIDLKFSESDIRVLQESSDFAFNAGLIKSRPIAKEVVDTELINEAIIRIRSSKSKSDLIRPVSDEAARTATSSQRWIKESDFAAIRHYGPLWVSRE
jgi:ABC-type nitrate/sulfonate/bicarbonate transport system substrate-binding protein